MTIRNSPAPSAEPVFCSSLSTEYGEQLFATVKQKSIWLLLEYPFPMSNKVERDNHLPAAVNEHLSMIKSALPSARLLFIKRKPDERPDYLSLYVAHSDDRQPRLYHKPLHDYADLLTIASTEIANPASGGGFEPQSGSLFVVCTNGKRDVCCARWGRPVYEQLSQLAVHVWESSHIGGHRFAANLISFPQGIHYGRVTAQGAGKIISAHQRGELVLENYRGRACYPPAAQAAEYFLRREMDELRLEAFNLERLTATSENSWQVIFSDQHASYDLNLVTRQSEYLIMESCSKPAERSTQTLFSLQSLEKREKAAS